MSAEPQPRPAPTELETVVNWRLIGAAAAAVVLLVVPVAVAVLLGPAAPPPKVVPAAPVALAPQVPQFVLPERPSQPPPATTVVVEWRPARSESPPRPAPPAPRE